MWVRAANVGLIGLWVVWAAPLVPWLVRGFSTDDGVAQGLVALLTVAWVGWTADLRAIRERLASSPEHRLPATVLALGAPIGAVVCGSVHETVMALWVVVGGYGLAGLYVSPGRWRDLRPVVLLAVVVLPVLLI